MGWRLLLLLYLIGDTTCKTTQTETCWYVGKHDGLVSVLGSMLVSMFGSVTVNLWLLISSITLSRLYSSQLPSINVRYYRRAQIAATWSPRRLYVTRWRQVFVGRQSWTCFLFPCWRLQFWGGNSICGNSEHPSVPALRITFIDQHCSRYSTSLFHIALVRYYLTTLFQIFMVTPCINDIKPFLVQLMHL